MKEAIHEVIHEDSLMLFFKTIHKSSLMPSLLNNMEDSTFSLLIFSIRSLLSLVSNFEVKFLRRQANMVAHTLAMTTYSRPRRCIFESIPPYNKYWSNEKS
jgi:hypothetical protein